MIILNTFCVFKLIKKRFTVRLLRNFLSRNSIEQPLRMDKGFSSKMNFYYLGSFFDETSHLLIHLGQGCQTGGPQTTSGPRRNILWPAKGFRDTAPVPDL